MWLLLGLAGSQQLTVSGDASRPITTIGHTGARHLLVQHGGGSPSRRVEMRNQGGRVNADALPTSVPGKPAQRIRRPASDGQARVAAVKIIPETNSPSFRAPGKLLRSHLYLIAGGGANDLPV
jgi:hypothetical protein